MRATRLLPLLFLLACKGDAPTPVPTAPMCNVGFADRDGDGYGNPNMQTTDCQEPVVDNGDDCDDLFNTAYPGATEICDGADNDCDGDIDAADADLDIPPQYVDGDGDGYGAGAPVNACDTLPGHAPLDGDCDDADPDVSPGAPEVCDDVDNNCDDEIDDADLDDLDFGSAPQWYVDSDGDGFAGPVLISACEQPPGASTDWNDCNDANPFAFPGALESCNGLDDDCDGDDDAGTACEGHQGDYAGTFTMTLTNGPSVSICTGTVDFSVLMFDFPPLRGDIDCTFDATEGWDLVQAGTIMGTSTIDGEITGTITLLGGEEYLWGGTISPGTGSASGLWIDGNRTYDVDASWTFAPVP